MLDIDFVRVGSEGASFNYDVYINYQHRIATIVWDCEHQYVSLQFLEKSLQFCISAKVITQEFEKVRKGDKYNYISVDDLYRFGRLQGKAMPYLSTSRPAVASTVVNRMCPPPSATSAATTIMYSPTTLKAVAVVEDTRALSERSDNYYSQHGFDPVSLDENLDVSSCTSASVEVSSNANKSLTAGPRPPSR